jgi:hypothetical protein
VNEPTVSDSAQTSGGRVLWDDAIPVYADGWRDSLLAMAAELDRRATEIASDRASLGSRLTSPAIAEVFMAAADMARQRAQNPPGVPDGLAPASQDPASHTDSLSVPDNMDPLFTITPEGMS